MLTFLHQSHGIEQQELSYVKLSPCKHTLSYIELWSTAYTQYPTPILNIPEVAAFLHVITEDKSRMHDIKRV